MDVKKIIEERLDDSYKRMENGEKLAWDIVVLEELYFQMEVEIIDPTIIEIFLDRNSMEELIDFLKELIDFDMCVLKQIAME